MLKVSFHATLLTQLIGLTMTRLLKRFGPNRLVKLLLLSHITYEEEKRALILSVSFSEYDFLKGTSEMRQNITKIHHKLKNSGRFCHLKMFSNLNIIKLS